MKASKAAGRGVLESVSNHRNIMLIERADGTFNVYEDEPKELRKYRPKRGERTSTHRAFVRLDR